MNYHTNSSKNAAHLKSVRGITSALTHVAKYVKISFLLVTIRANVRLAGANHARGISCRLFRFAEKGELRLPLWFHAKDLHKILSSHTSPPKSQIQAYKGRSSASRFHACDCPQSRRDAKLYPRTTTLYKTIVVTTSLVSGEQDRLLLGKMALQPT